MEFSSTREAHDVGFVIGWCNTALSSLVLKLGRLVLSIKRRLTIFEWGWKRKRCGSRGRVNSFSVLIASK